MFVVSACILFNNVYKDTYMYLVFSWYRCTNMKRWISWFLCSHLGFQWHFLCIHLKHHRNINWKMTNCKKFATSSVFVFRHLYRSKLRVIFLFIHEVYALIQNYARDPMEWWMPLNDRYSERFYFPFLFFLFSLFLHFIKVFLLKF